MLSCTIATRDGSGSMPAMYRAAAATEWVLVGEVRKKPVLSLPSGVRFMVSPVTVAPITGRCAWAVSFAAAARVLSMLWPSPITETTWLPAACSEISSTASDQLAYWLPMFARNSLTFGTLPWNAAVWLARHTPAIAPSMSGYRSG